MYERRGDHGRSNVTARRSRLAAEVAALHERGFVVLEGVLRAGEIDDVRDELTPHLQGRHFGRNDFEGRRSERVYALLAKAPSTGRLVEHPRVLALVESVLEPQYLLSAHLAINLHPGEKAQSWHYDDGYCAIPRPRDALGVSTIWAIDDFTDDNGATEVIPGSHRFDDELPVPNGDDVGRVTMPAGSVLVFLGTLWHRGGANRSDAHRLAITAQYCQPWIRQIETMTLAVPPRVARRYSTRVQELLGYSIYPPFIGYVDGMHPRRLIHAAAEEAAPRAAGRQGP